MATKTKKATKLKRLTRVDVDNAQDLEERWFPMPEWGGQVLLRALPMETYDAIQGESKKAKDGELDWDKIGYLMISKCLIDANTKEPMYSFDEVFALQKKSIGAITKLIGYVQDINNLGDEEKKDLDAALSPMENGAISSNSQND